MIKIPHIHNLEWELNALNEADKIVVFIDPETKSPITLLEIGLHAESRKMCVLP